MAHLLHIDTSFKGDSSVSRQLTARAAQRWRDAHEGATVTYRDFGVDPLPHLTAETGLAPFIPAEHRSPEQAARVALSTELIDEIKAADAVVLGLPLYNFGAPSTVKAWLDHIIVDGLSVNQAAGEGLLGGREFLVLESRGGGYQPGTPRHGWDHAEAWLPHAFSQIGLEPRFITAELTLADTNPALAQFKELAAESLGNAEREIDALWTPVAA